jgi:dipeptidyl peptidase-like protein/NlpC/P60 family protein
MADRPPLDPRITPARPDRAARHLEGKVKADRFVDGELREVVAPQAPVRREPRPDAPLDTEALKGERVMVYESTEEGWSWGQLLDDSYVGWIPSDALRAPGQPATHVVSALRTLVFPGPSIKLPPMEALSFGSRIAISWVKESLAVTATDGFIPFQHLTEGQLAETDFVSVAERFLGAPYLWGGKTSLALDCSALVQLSLSACGVRCPRDSDLQERALGKPISTNDISSLRRGDLVFWKGHVAIVRDTETLVHANASDMAVAIEPIREAIERMRRLGLDISSVRRLPHLANAPK